MMLTPEAQQRMAAVQQQQQRMAFAAQTRPGMPPGAPIQVRPGPPPGAAPVPQVRNCQFVLTEWLPNENKIVPKTS